MDTQFGCMGFAALMSSLCLSPPSVLSQTPSVPPTVQAGAVQSVDLPSEPPPPTLQQLQEQFQSALQAIEALRQATSATLDLVATSVTAQVTLLKEDFTTRHELDVQAMRRSHHTLLAVVLVMIGLLALGVMFIALVPLRMMNRLAARAVVPPARSVADAYQAAFTPLEKSNTRLQSAMQRLERRLIELEARSAQLQAGGASAGTGPEVKPAASAVAPAPARAAAKPGATPRVSLAMGRGEALLLLPQDMRGLRFRSYLNVFQKIRNLFKPSAPPKTAP